VIYQELPFKGDASRHSLLMLILLIVRKQAHKRELSNVKSKWCHANSILLYLCNNARRV
jgi:hypothetical protein